MLITIWERFDKDKNKWRHNHISEHFYISESKPSPKKPIQIKLWEKGIWRKKLGTLNNYQVKEF